MNNNLNEQLLAIDIYISNSKFKDTWQSLAQYQVPNWYKQAKFGLFSHYGVYNVPQFGSEWYARNMYVEGSKSNLFHVQNYGPLDKFGYKDLIKDFKCSKFDSDQWMKIIKNSGARYYIPVAEHHDGFQMYESKISDDNAFKLGPKRDIILELAKAAKKNNIEFGVSSHRAEHFFFMSEAKKCKSDIIDPNYGDMYWPSIDEEIFGEDHEVTKLFLEDWLCRCCELVDLFEPKIVYFDWWIEMAPFMPYLRKFLAYFYNRSLEFHGEAGVVNYKHDAIPYLLAVRDMERGQFESVQNDYWQCCTSIATNSWSHTNQNVLKPVKQIIEVLVDVVSKNGNLLLNFCPHLDGFITKKEEEVLGQIGNWLKINGSGIYDTHPWKIFGEGDTNVLPGDFGEANALVYRTTDFRFTQRANSIFVFIMNPSNEKTFRIKEFGQRRRNLKWHNDIENVILLEDASNKISYKRTEDYLEINFEKEMSNAVQCVEFKFI